MSGNVTPLAAGMRGGRNRGECQAVVPFLGSLPVCVWRQASRLRMLKVFSPPADPSQAIVEALRQIVAETNPDADLVLLHGTTVGTNTLLERKGARTALVTTAGFEVAIELVRQARPNP